MNKNFTYPIKILSAFGEAINGNEDIFKWLLENGYEPLAKLSEAIRGDQRAFQWLVENCPQYAAFDRAIDNNFKSKIWLKKHGFTFYIIFADACAGNPEAIGWLAKRNLTIYIRIAKYVLNDMRIREKKRGMF